MINIIDLTNDPRLIERIVRKIEREYKAIKGLILSESDLKCLIFSRLMRLRKFSYPCTTIDDGVYATAVHTELSWYDQDGN